MKYIKLFENFEENEVNKLKEDFDAILVELVDEGFYIKYYFSKPYNSKDEIEISIHYLNYGDTALSFSYEAVKDYIKTIKDYMDSYYKCECDIMFIKSNSPKLLVNGYDRFIFGHEESKNSKINSEEMFRSIKILFKNIDKK